MSTFNPNRGFHQALYAQVLDRAATERLTGQQVPDEAAIRGVLALLAAEGLLPAAPAWFTATSDGLTVHATLAAAQAAEGMTLVGHLTPLAPARPARHDMADYEGQPVCCRCGDGWPDCTNTDPQTGLHHLHRDTCAKVQHETADGEPYLCPTCAEEPTTATELAAASNL